MHAPPDAKLNEGNGDHCRDQLDVVSYDDTLKAALAAKIAQMDKKQSEDKDEEKALAKLYKKASKDLKDQLEGMSDGNEKVKLLQQKYLDKLQECNRMERTNGNLQRSLEKAQSERDAAKAELSKVNSVKQKLEVLCKELQKQNKDILERSKLISEEEQKRRNELSEKFHVTIKDVQEKMEQQEKNRLAEAEESDKLREKLREFISKYEVKEQYYENQLRAKDLECQLAEAKSQRTQEICKDAIQQAETYKKEMEKQQISHMETFQQYGSKVQVMQEALAKSNEVFSTFKKDTEKLRKRIKVLEKEKKDLMDKTGSASELSKENEQTKKELASMRKQKERLEALCRTLTQERAQWKGSLKEGEGDGKEVEQEEQALEEVAADVDSTQEQEEA
uniref:Uncharacterized protein n=1 Tax=Guillardia theta TaxID=55529 RepID=A0A7S4MZK8_GUITH